MSNDVKIFGGIIGATILLIVGAVFFMGRNEQTDSKAQNAKPIIYSKKDLIEEDSWAIGSPSAKVTIVEFGDYQCPSCKLTEPVVKQLLKAYGDKIYFVYRHFPLTQIHEYALTSADAAEAAGMQDKFWDYHHKLYEISPDLKPENLSKIAKDLKLDEEKFSADSNGDAARQRVLNDMSAGNKVAITGTPTFFINGRRLDLGRLPTLADFKTEIDPLLN